MIYISPPFGNYISLKDCYSVAGTYTYFRRKGLIKQVLKTLRPVKGGWRNSIGLRKIPPPIPTFKGPFILFTLNKSLSLNFHA